MDLGFHKSDEGDDCPCKNIRHNNWRFFVALDSNFHRLHLESNTHLRSDSGEPIYSGSCEPQLFRGFTFRSGVGNMARYGKIKPWELVLQTKLWVRMKWGIFPLCSKWFSLVQKLRDRASGPRSDGNFHRGNSWQSIESRGAVPIFRPWWLGWTLIGNVGAGNPKLEPYCHQPNDDPHLSESWGG